MFVDASALVAIIAREADADPLLAVIEAASAAVTSPVALYEATLAVRRKGEITVAQAQSIVGRFLATVDVQVVPITPEIGTAALAAFARYGKGQGHPAQLNMGDCFAYAAAKLLGVPLLFKGDDFGHTDIIVAA